MQHQCVIGKEKIALYGVNPKTSETLGTFRCFFVVTHVTTKRVIRNQLVVHISYFIKKMLCMMIVIFVVYDDSYLCCV